MERLPTQAPTFRPHATVGHTLSYSPLVPQRDCASARGYGGSRWERLRRACFLRDGYLCRRCGALCIEGDTDHGHRPHCDHILPKSQGGKDTLSNVQTLCGACHSGKTGRERKGKGKGPTC